MISIVKAAVGDSKLLADIGKVSLLESHGRSAPASDMNIYANKIFNFSAIENELREPKNIYHLLYFMRRPAGFSKILFDCPHANIELKNIAKLERLYLLNEFHGLGLGYGLFEFNLELSKKNNQAGMWLFVWKENQKAVRFYEKAGFKIIGSHDFRISQNHSNPNHHMFLEF